MHFWYKLLTYLFYPFSIIFLLLRRYKKKEHTIRYKEKLSIISKERGEGFLVWFHVASVGEALSILPLIKELEKIEKIKKILITSITLSSSEVLQNKLSQNKKVLHQFLPLDIPIFINKFLVHWKPNLSIFVDSEIWPNLIFQIKKNNIPLLLVNGRITQKSFLKWRYVSSYAKKIFQKFDLCIAANKESELNLKILGAKYIKNYGNIKFTGSKFNISSKLNTNFLSKIEKRKIWCAASTHSSEEIFCGRVHLNIKKIYKNVLTILIPRHVNRINKINKELLDLGLKVTLYSNQEDINSNTDILLVDSYGETSKFYNVSKSVFLGGSLIKHGGQNPIEPSRLGCKVFHGPYTNNFTEIYKYFKSLDAAHEIHSVDDLCQSIVEEFRLNKPYNDEVVRKIDNYGLDILNNVMKEIKTYINA